MPGDDRQGIVERLGRGVLGRALSGPATKTGTMGISGTRAANLPIPLWNRRISPGAPRVPSGKAMMLRPASIRSLISASGGDARTFSGLAGLGDLVLTCTGGLSRNRRTGLELAAGKSLAEIQGETSMVAEGIRNSLSLTRLANRLQIEMPITQQMMAVMYEGKSPTEAVRDLMTRALKAETEL